MFLSVFDLYKIGIGPSSSHTMGPMVAAGLFLDELENGVWPRPEGSKPDRLKAFLYGSLAFTGVGHATDRAVALGFDGAQADTIDPATIAGRHERIKREKRVRPSAKSSYAFDPSSDLIFDYDTPSAGHPNGLAFEAHDADGRVLLRRLYYSVGGGFVVTDDVLHTRDVFGGEANKATVPFPFASAHDMLAMAATSGKSIAEMKRANELASCDAMSLDCGLDALWHEMDMCIERGLSSDGILPGGLNVTRRAPGLAEKLAGETGLNTPNPIAANEWLAAYAMAVNEENAAGGRVVTAPTNGAAGVVPAVLKYATVFLGKVSAADIRTFLLTSAAVGGIIKHKASISGAEVGCQGEVGSAAAMAAAGLAALMGATPEQVENAAEIALEHHLGMTCDPVAGLVQVPCIERNGIGAVKAVTAASLAVRGSGDHVVSLDACIETMRQTGADMDEKYKETSRGGL
ncbi:MAG: L-serine ammonia-lyase, partial [Pseudomonadota bacterium]